MINNNEIQVVIADGDAENSIYNHKYLEPSQHNINVIYAESISKLNNILLHAKVDILLFSLKQPDGSGVEYIKKIGFQNTMGIIILADKKNSDNYTMALENGADDFLCYSSDYKKTLLKIKILYRRIYE